MAENLVWGSILSVSVRWWAARVVHYHPCVVLLRGTSSSACRFARLHSFVGFLLATFVAITTTPLHLLFSFQEDQHEGLEALCGVLRAVPPADASAHVRAQLETFLQLQPQQQRGSGLSHSSKAMISISSTGICRTAA